MVNHFNEMYLDGAVRAPYVGLEAWLAQMPPELRKLKQEEAETLFRRIGITFAVYGEGGDPDRLIPFDLFPRVFTHNEWAKLERGIKQRARALNAFLVDVYGRGEIVRAGRIPAHLVYQNDAYEIAAAGFIPPRGVYSHIVGIDIVRTGPDDFFVLEDNCRTPSGVSYMLESREIMMRMFPDLFRENRIEPVDRYAELLRRTLISVAPAKCDSRADCRDPHPRPFQLGLLRALLPRRPDGRRTGRGPGSLRRRPLRLHAHYRRSQTRRRDLPPHRRRLPRPALFPPRFDARRARPDGRLPLGRA